jgi:hypothetical protein
MNVQVAAWAAQELVARRALGAAVKAHRKHRPRLERARRLLSIYTHMLEKEER